MNQYLLEDPSWNGPMILALQRAIISTFIESDWHEVGHLTGQYSYITGHDRLLRSLSWGDTDYGDCVFNVINHLQHYSPQGLVPLIEHPKLLPLLENSVPQLLAKLGLSVGHVRAVVPSQSASEVVRRALADADQLIVTNGAQSAVDRLHTAMHGYLRAECATASIPLPGNATLTQAFKALRSGHPTLTTLGNHGVEVGKVLQSFAAVLDALNTIRNHGSVAHPTDHLIEAAEASLFVNAVRTIFHYLNTKLGQ